MTANIKASIASIADDAWTAIEYTARSVMRTPVS